MENFNQNSDKTVASLIHVSTFSKYIIPFGNFILPLILWTAKKEDYFVNEHGKQALNFQISMFLYFVLLLFLAIAGVIYLGLEISFKNPLIFSEEYINIYPALISLPLLFFLGVVGVLFLALFILDIVAVITAAIKASEGKLYKYPLTINFITPTPVGIHQSKNDQFNNTQNETL